MDNQEHFDCLSEAQELYKLLESIPNEHKDNAANACIEFALRWCLTNEDSNRLSELKEFIKNE